jgi:4-hydroxy-4-methyl-2-oxoglutarate aldolase
MTGPPVACEFSAATLFESGAAGPMASQIGPLVASWRVAGPAFTVALPAGHNIWLHRAVYAAQPGDVLVVSTGGGSEFGYWGEVLTHAAREAGLAGLVIDGCVRDASQLRAAGFPVFARGLCVRGTGKNGQLGGGLGQQIEVGGCTVEPGDLIVGDEDGVVLVPGERAAEVMHRAHSRVAAEAVILERIAAGASTLDLYGLA